MRATIVALAVLLSISLVEPIAAQTVEFPTTCTDVLRGGTIFIGHDCGEWASIVIVGAIVIREPWSGTIPASRAARIRARRDGAAAPRVEPTRTPRRTPSTEPTRTPRRTPRPDPLDDIAAVDVSGGSSEGPDCEDFSTQRQAQAYFDARGWSADDDPYRLDQGGIPGVPCEALP